MIKENGIVTISEDHIDISKFTFEGVNFPDGGIEALTWAKKKISKAIQDYPNITFQFHK